MSLIRRMQTNVKNRKKMLKMT